MILFQFYSSEARMSGLPEQEHFITMVITNGRGEKVGRERSGSNDTAGIYIESYYIIYSIVTEICGISHLCLLPL